MRPSEQELHEQFDTFRMLMSSRTFWRASADIRNVIVGDVALAYMTANIPEIHVPAVCLEYKELLTEYDNKNKLIQLDGPLC